ncbi:mitochondrial inner membrane protein 1 [Rhodotorula toruloides]|uniref:Mitochondrial inner membrane protein 1 n=1 Tax=Rhodotorula toruloides TaxID=5286 RepID=A0A511KMZ8_RHOTO|nr:mitochondrial inner membrane protein 1 [Rhodotorula toruloides]
MFSTRLIGCTRLRHAAFPLYTVAPHPHRLFATTQLARFSHPTRPALEASPVSQQPASKNLKDMGKSAAEEAQGVARTVAEAIAGEANDVTSQNAPKEKFGAGDITADIASMKELVEDVPKPAIRWGVAGLIPYAGTSLAIVHFARQAKLAVENGESAGYDPQAAFALLEHAQLLQVQYGAIIISFLGAVHWGLEWAKFGGVQGNARYLLGVAPVVAGWGSLLIPGNMALVTQWAAFFGQWYADSKTTEKGWSPKWYATTLQLRELVTQYRFWLTSIVGGSILVSLAARGYYAADLDLAKSESQVKKLMASRPPDAIGTNPKGTSVELGGMRAEKAEDAYVKFTNLEKEREKQKEEEEKAKKEEEKQKKEEQKKESKKKDIADQVKKAED